MRELSFDQKEDIGLQWVLDELHPASACGRERLRALRPAAAEEKPALERELDDLQHLVDAGEEHRKLYGQLAHAFSQVKDLRRTFERCREMSLSDVELFEIKGYLLQLERLSPLMACLEDELGVQDAALLPCGDALRLLDIENRGTATFFISSRYSEELAAVRREKKWIEEEIRTVGTAGDALQAERSAVIAREEREEEAVRRRLSQELRPWLNDMAENLERIARLDLLLEKVRLARAWGAVRPKLGGDTLRFEGLISPHVARAVQEKGGAFTPVDICLSRGATVITGANMGGKSVALRAVLLNVLLAHMGFFVFAQRAEIPLFDEAILIAEDEQSVRRGLSSFGAEIAALGDALHRMEGRFCLLVLDEFARGTNPEEGRRIVRALVRYLSEKGSIALLATHYDGTARDACAHYQVAGLRDVDPARLADELRASGGGFEAIRRHMDYRLLPAGALDECPRSALTICRMLLPQEDLIRAIEENY